MRNEEQTYRDSLTRMLEEMRDDLKETKMQTKLTNGRVTKLEKYMTIGLTAIAVIIILKVPELLPLLKLAV